MDLLRLARQRGILPGGKLGVGADAACTPDSAPKHAATPAGAGGDAAPIFTGPVHLTAQRVSDCVVSPLGGPQRCCYIPDVVDENGERALLAAVAASPEPWVTLRGRRLKEFGGKPTAHGIEDACPLPAWLAPLCEALQAAGVFPASLAVNHALLNEYAESQGILAHTDGPRFHPTVATLSLGDASVMHLTVLHGREQPGERGGQCLGELLLAPRSLVITSGALYLQYAHGIAEGEAVQLGAGPRWAPLPASDATAGAGWRVEQRSTSGGSAGDGDSVEVLHRGGTRLSITLRHAYTAEELAQLQRPG